MKISLNWLQEYIDTDVDIDKISEILTCIGLEVEGIETFESIKGGLQKYYIGEVLTCVKHPNADKLKLTEVDLGSELGVKKIVCGAPNVAVGQKVVVATEGAVVYLPNGEHFTIKKAKIRGEESNGMICAEDELGIGKGHEGILVLEHSAIIGTPTSDYFDISQDTVFEIGLTPNRTDAMCHYGVARDLAAALSVRKLPFTFHAEGKHKPNAKILKNNTKYTINIKTDKAPIVGLVTIENVSNAESPKWMANRLKAIGVQPKNLLVDTTNYILHDLGHPIHAYDINTIKGNTINIEEATNTEEFLALNDAKLKIEKGDIVIKDNTSTLGLAGIMGGKNSEVNHNTSNVLIEGAYFSSESIRKSSQRLKIQSEAASKFEKGANPNGVEAAIAKARDIILRQSPQATTSQIDIESKVAFAPFEVCLRYKKLNQYAGIEIEKPIVESILTSLGITIKNREEDSLILTIPRYKDDVRREVDVLEEILRIYGYDNIPYPKKLKSNLSFESNNSNEQFDKKLKNLLIGRGFSEVMTNSISQSKFYNEKNTVKLLNSMTSELDCMRTSLMPGILEIIEYNIRRGEKNIALFEIGKEYQQDEVHKYSENKKTIVAITGLSQSQSWANSKGVKNDYFALKSVLEELLGRFNFQYSLQIKEITGYLYGVEIVSNDKAVGYLGLCDISHYPVFDIQQEVFVLELDCKAIGRKYSKQKLNYTEVSKFPAVRRDLALVLDKDIMYQEIENISKKSLKDKLVSINLFDIFEDKSLGENKKSYAIRLVIQNKEKTMSDKDIDKLMTSLMKEFEDQLKAEVRS